jgi:L-rhamnose isomerase
MAAKCPTTGFSCINQLVARTATIGQAIDETNQSYVGKVVSPDVAALLVYLDKLQYALNIALHEYTDDHDEPVLEEWLDAVRWYDENMRS